MFNWAKQQLANVAGTQEPIYGPSAIQSVSKQAETTPYTEITREDLKWQIIDQTSVETQTFYLTADSGHSGLAQVIHSNVAGIRTTTQFNIKIFYPRSENKAPLWVTDYVSEVEFSEDKNSFYGKDVAIELSADGAKYTIKSMVNQGAVVNLSFTRAAPGFVAGTDGKSTFGTDPKAPWGSMRHAFWPRNNVEGSIVTKDGPVDFKGKGLFVHALQGMKPHHAAAKWTFVNYQAPTYTAVMMEFTTPESYGKTVVNVGAVVKDGEIVIAGSPFTATHTKTKPDVDNDWQEPEEVKFEWNGKSKDGKTVSAVLEGSLETRVDRIDIMEEVPGFVKNLVAAAAGTKPYIYQYLPATSPPLKLKIDDNEITEQGVLFSESTFIVA